MLADCASSTGPGCFYCPPTQSLFAVRLQPHPTSCIPGCKLSRCAPRHVQLLQAAIRLWWDFLCALVHIAEKPVQRAYWLDLPLEEVLEWRNLVSDSGRWVTKLLGYSLPLLVLSFSYEVWGCVANQACD